MGIFCLLVLFCWVLFVCFDFSFLLLLRIFSFFALRWLLLKIFELGALGKGKLTEGKKFCALY